jgi:ribosomal protein L29
LKHTASSRAIDLRAEMQQMKRKLREDLAALRLQTAAGFLHVLAELRSANRKLDTLLELHGRRKR